MADIGTLATPHEARVVLDVAGSGYNGYASDFAKLLCQLAFKCDHDNRLKLARGFPEMVDAVEWYLRSPEAVRRRAGDVVIIRTPNISRPQDYQEISAPAGMSNFGHGVDDGIEGRLRAEEVWTRYAGHGFNGHVWFDRELQGFACQVWCHGQPIATVRARTIEDLMRGVSDEWGWD